MGSQIFKKKSLKSTSNFIFPKSIFDPKSDESNFFCRRSNNFPVKICLDVES